MKNFTISKHLNICLLLILNLSLSAQNLIIENIKTQPNSPYNIKSNFDKENFTTVLDEGVKKLHISNQLNNQNTASQGQDNVNETAYLSIDLEFDWSLYFPSLIEIYNESGYRSAAFFVGDLPIVVEVPHGTYDVICRFSNMSNQQSHYVIKELVEINGDTSISLDQETASNYVSVETYKENGEILHPGVYGPSTEVYSGMIFSRSLQFRPSSELYFSVEAFIWEFPFEEDPVWNFYINDVSDRYSINQSFIGYGNENNISYFSKLPSINGISESLTVSNSYMDYVYHIEKFKPTPINTEGVNPGYFTWITNGDFAVIGWDLYNTQATVDPDEGFKAYINNPIEENSSNLLVYPGVVDHVYVDPQWGDVYVYMIQGSPIVMENGKINYGSGNTSNYFFNEIGLKELPFHPKFTFSEEHNTDIRFGSTTPMAVIMPYVVPNNLNQLSIQYKGNYGESRKSDLFNSEIEIKRNGSVIYSGSYFGAGNLPNSGQFEITITNPNTAIEDSFGINTTIISYNASNSDLPPSLQMIQFRDGENKVTSLLSSAESASVRLAAGDYVFNTVFGTFEYTDGNDLKLYYSPTTMNDWRELELTHYPEFFQAPGFGDYYEASLETVAVPFENSWFDVKVVCTDQAGNFQEQIISLAFRISEANMGIDEVSDLYFNIYPNPFSNELNIKIPEILDGDYTFKITDLSGKLIYSQKRNARSSKSFIWNGASLPKGIYTVSIENKGKTIAQKIIKK